jgi:hypothetical protein
MRDNTRPSISTSKVMGFASLYPSYELVGSAMQERCLRRR